MNDKYAKRIADELKLIRVELQKMTPQEKTDLPQTGISIDGEEVTKIFAGERVTIK